LALVQPVLEVGGVVSAAGLQPAYDAGHADPFEHTRFWQVSDFVEQLSHSTPYSPQLSDVLPGSHAPVALQQPLQLSGPQCTPE
jgi:hypothetical protein